MYKGCAPRISELVFAGRKRHQVQFVDNPQKSTVGKVLILGTSDQ